MMQRNRTLHVYEIFEKLRKAKTKPEKIDILRANYKNTALLDILRGTYNENIQFLVAKGDPPYKPARKDAAPSSINKQYMKFGYFQKGNEDAERLPPEKIRKIYINLLETIEPDDAKLVINMINKVPYERVTKNMIAEALPGIFPGYVADTEAGLPKKEKVKTKAKKPKTEKKVESVTEESVTEEKTESVSEVSPSEETETVTT